MDTKFEENLISIISNAFNEEEKRNITDTEIKKQFKK